ncbi:cytosolic Fe-S cluster assembly factor NUBP2 homolog [Caerostris extrusa]|uniref:Cytosolic Fe-S cluster assembly factor NUBP2 homolog n=1 Tax=Caerostris extrusa TaxID=172846 RepID=A0AAV4MHN8_CAEEX|nr:cytosolic Fe-S cluster assembly factor NUBP2 homolog [Caerostris extrusa]
MGIEDVKKIILVLSGKGGVGKSSVAAHLALSLRDLNFKVGLLDVDLCGPSIPYMLNMEGKDIHQCSSGWMPVFTDSSQSFAVMSIGFLLNDRNDAVIWRGPKKNAMIKQFLTDVYWQSLDYLVIDMPPGTTDEHITIAENLKNVSNVGAVLVTTPQIVAVGDVLREITFCKKASLRILGIIENMSGFVCPHCKECSAVFSQGGGEHLAKTSNLPFLGSIPLDPIFANSIQKRCMKEDIGEMDTLKIFSSIAETIVNSL